MSDSQETAECANCRTTIEIDTGTLQNRIPCAKCGSTVRNYHVSIIETAVVRDGLGVKVKRPGEKRPYIEDISVPDFSFSKNKLVLRQRVIDRDHDEYFEKVTDYETGEVIHH